MSLFGVALDITVKRINYEIRLVLHRQDLKEVKELTGVFEAFDVSGQKKLTFKEFEAALKKCGYSCLQS